MSATAPAAGAAASAVLRAGADRWHEQAVIDAVDACRRITRQRAANFYWGLRLTPEPKRSAMYAIYAWMRRADDIVDEAVAAGAVEGVRAQVDSFRSLTRLALAGDAGAGHRCADPELKATLIALSAAACAYPLAAEDFDGMLEGQVEDVEPRHIATRAELERWCWKVASTVGIACVRVWGHSPGPALELAAARGIGFQLTNVIRDFLEDAGNGRVYFPKDELDAAGLDVQSLRAWSRPRECRAFILAQCDRARAMYAQSAPLDAMVTPDCRPVLWALTEIYRQLLERIAEDPEAVVRRRVSLPLWRKLAIGLAARRRAGHGGAS